MSHGERDAYVIIVFLFMNLVFFVFINDEQELRYYLRRRMRAYIINTNKNMERTENVIVLGAGTMGGYANYGNHVHIVVHGGDVGAVLMVMVVGDNVVAVGGGVVYMLPGRTSNSCCNCGYC